MRPRQIERLQVEGLFGYLDHDVRFRDAPATIITGPNGSGKTHVLRILRALVALDLRELLGYPFGRAELKYTDDSRLGAIRDGSDAPVLMLSGYRRDNLLGEVTIGPFIDDEGLEDLPPWIERAGPDIWWDQEVQEMVTTDQLRARYRGLLPEQESRLIDSHPWLAQFGAESTPVFVETGRLDVALRPVTRHPGRPPVRRPRRPRAPIERYVVQITNQISEARQASLSVSQRADRRFAAKALDRARTTVRESVLRARYQSLADLHHELHANGLTDEAIEVALPEQRTNPTERRILDVFLEDWEAKLHPLQPVHEKLEALRRIVASKIRQKQWHIAASGEVTFISPTGEALAVTLLSSGEQHMLALFTMFLFTARPYSLVMIDEPELSLHAAWKHAFLDDIAQVTKLIPVQVVLATHSTALINSRWDLVEELDA